MSKTVKHIIRNCGPLVIFAREYPDTIEILRQMRAAWPTLETILFGVMHMCGTKVPDMCVADCDSVWTSFQSSRHDITAFVTKVLLMLPCYAKLPFNLRAILGTSMCCFIASRITRDAEQAKTGKPCSEIWCVCALLDNACLQLKDIVLDEDMTNLWKTRQALFAPKNKRVVQKQKARKRQCLPEFSDSEDDRLDQRLDQLARVAQKREPKLAEFSDSDDGGLDQDQCVSVDQQQQHVEERIQTDFTQEQIDDDFSQLSTVALASETQ